MSAFKIERLISYQHVKFIEMTKYTPNVGLEPTTVGLRVQRSTDWASRALISCFYNEYLNRFWSMLPACSRPLASVYLHSNEIYWKFHLFISENISIVKNKAKWNDSKWSTLQQLYLKLISGYSWFLKISASNKF